ncbi:MAG TPA: PAS domain-containing protein, partial [Prosthecobacter sp.]|nr:PAS domain-containing protein [Prosthecobacter sp.]
MDTPGTSYQSLTAQLAAAQQELSALRVAYGRTQRILNHLPDGVTVQDAAGILVYANAAAAHLAGFPNAAAMLQAPAATLWSGVELHDAAGHPITPGQLPGQRVLLGDQEPPPMTIGVRSGSRETQQWAAMRAMPLRDAHGQVEGVMTICHDVTNRMLRERAVFAATLAAVPDAVVVTDVHGVITDANPVAESLLGQSAQHMLGQPLDQLIRPAMADGDRGDLLRHDRPALAAHLDEGTAIPVELHTSPIHDAQGDRLGAVQIIRAVRGQPADEPRLTEHAEVLTVINQTGQLLAAELDLQTLVQAVTDATTSLIGAEFGSFFYNVRTADGDAYTLYTIAGVPREAFATFPMPRNTKIFSPTFEGTGIVRSDDITQDPRYGQNPPYHGMPPGHLPVRSYLAVPVISRLGEVIGGLFFGHSQTGVFTARSEQLIVGLVSQTAIAMDNARLYAAAQAEIIQRAQAEQHLRLITDTLPVLVAYVTPAHTYHFVNQAYESWFGAPRDRIIGQDLRMMAGEAAYTAIREYVERALAGETVMYERMITLKTGAVRTIQATYIPDQDDQGAVRGFVSLIMDITQRKQDEDALRMHAH